MTHLDPEQLESAARGEAFAHLAGCAECTQAAADARGRQKLLGGLTPYTLSDMAFRRVEAKLMETVDAGLPTPGMKWWWLMPLAATLVVSVVVSLWLLQPAKREGTLEPMVTPVAVTAPFEPLTVLAASGDARSRVGDAAWTALTAGAVLDRGVAVSGERVVLAPASGTRWAFAVDGTAALGDAATVALGAGMLQVEAGGDLLFAATGAHRVEAVDAAFVLTRAAAEVVLAVHRGEVTVVDTLTGTRRVVKAPAQLRWGDGVALGQGVSEPMGAAPPALVVPKQPWATLDGAGLPEGTKLSVDDLPVGVGPLTALVEAGRRKVTVLKPGQAELVSWLDLVAGSAVVVPTEAAPAVVDTEADPAALEQLATDLKRQRPKLAACYDKWLKANPGAAADVVLTLSINAKGKVTRAQVTGDAAPVVDACLKRTSKTLVLPRLGAPQEVEVPLKLLPKGR